MQILNNEDVAAVSINEMVEWTQMNEKNVE
jgi:hypothetical protein